eukprot:1586171-Rhodomonas_salina.1
MSLASSVGDVDQITGPTSMMVILGSAEVLSLGCMLSVSVRPSTPTCRTRTEEFRMSVMARISRPMSESGTAKRFPLLERYSAMLLSTS